jgi:hypothetical protein
MTPQPFHPAPTDKVTTRDKRRHDDKSKPSTSFKPTTPINDKPKTPNGNKPAPPVYANSSPQSGTTPTSVQYKALFADDFESGNPNNFDLIGNDSSKVVQLADGNHVAFFRLNGNSDNNTYSEIAPKPATTRLHEGQAYTAQFQEYLVDLKSSSSQTTLFQIVALPRGGTADQSSEGPISLSVQNGLFAFKVAGKTIWTQPYSEKTWYSWTIQLKLARPNQSNSSAGYVQVMLNGKNVAASSGTNLTNVVDADYAVKLGLSQANIKANPSSNSNREMYGDNVRLYECSMK